MTLPVNQIVLGDCIEVMKSFADSSIDCVVTDPPYGLNFMGKEWDKALPPKQAFVEMCRVLKPGALAFVMSSPRQDLMWRMAQLLEESGFKLGQSFISWIYASGFPKAYDISKGIDAKKGLEREVIGKGKGTSLNYQNRINSEHGFRPSDYYEDKNSEFDVTKAVSDEAKQWEGWKAISGLKPALEVIFMVQKPMSEKSIVDNVLKWGTGAINVDACRIPFQGEEDIGNPDRGKGYPLLDPKKGFNQNKLVNNITIGEKGRFPANLLISEGGMEAPTSFSRYFDLDAWARHHGILQVPKASTAERDIGLEGEETKIPKSKFNLNNGSLDERFDGGKLNPRANVHPTVKPIKLMSYLIELGCPLKGIVLDPFVGTGTTCIAANRLSRNYIGIEIVPEYANMATKRIKGIGTNLEMWFE